MEKRARKRISITISDDTTIAVYICETYLCMRIHCRGMDMCDHIQKLRRTSGDGGVITNRYADTFSRGSLQMESSKDRRVEIREGKEHFAR